MATLSWCSSTLLLDSKDRRVFLGSQGAGRQQQSGFNRRSFATSHTSTLRRYPSSSAICGEAVPLSGGSIEFKTGIWTWKISDRNINIHYEEHFLDDGLGSSETILFLPTISDVSTTEEWRAVAQDLLTRKGQGWRIVIVDWPGFGLSDRPRMNYDADSLEGFLLDFVSAGKSPLNISDKLPIIIGGGHAATLAVRAIQKKLIRARAIAAVAPTWAGPMPIVFGRSPDMKTRYDLLRNSLEAPGLGWMMYNFMVSSPQNISKQYLSHVYADPDNVTPSLLASRLALTKRDGARFAPAAFLTGMLDPVNTRNEFLSIFEELEGKIPVIVLAAKNAPKRSKAEMEALNGAKGVSYYVEVKGALLPQEEYPEIVAEELYKFLISL